MTEHPSLLYKKQVTESFQDSISNISEDLVKLNNKYKELKETDLTINTLTELTDRLNSFESKLDNIITVLQNSLQPSSVEEQLLQFLTSKIK